MIDGFISGIKDKAKAVGDAVSGIASTVGGWLGFSSPADKGDGRYIEVWGANMIDGFLDGAMSKKREAGKAMNNIIGAMQPDHLSGTNFNVAGSLGGQVTQQVNHSVNSNAGRTEQLLEQLANSNQVIVLDSGELVGATYPQYDRVGGNQTQLTERWGR